MDTNTLIVELVYDIEGRGFSAAGRAASEIKKVLTEIGFEPGLVRRVMVVAYEAEMNIVIHAYRGQLIVRISRGRVDVIAADEGPGIPDVDLAMREGYSTAPQSVREMGFGAGMGLPNIQRHADNMEIKTEVAKGTELSATIFIENR